MNKKNAFTLVELLAVIVILVVIIVISVPSLLNSINNKKNDALNKVYDLVESAARNYAMDYNLELPTKIELDVLCGRYMDCPVINPNTNEELTGYVFAEKDYYYSEVEETFVEVDPLGGILGQEFEEKYEPGTVIQLIDPTKDDLKFAGWKVVKGNSGLRDDKLVIGTTDTIVWATWTTNEFVKLTLDLDGGTISKEPESEYLAGSTVTLESPTKEGYTFTGWTLVSGNSIVSGNIFTMGSEDTKIKAMWEVNTYMVSYDFNGGSISANYNTPAEHTYTVPYSGIYELEVWGAQGGSAKYSTTYSGGYGGYSKGQISLSENETLYINVGGMGITYGSNSSTSSSTENGSGYNGGGTGIAIVDNSARGGGGGATHIATISGELSELEDYKDDILIAAGGGGGGASHKSAPSYSGTGGSGGGFNGVNSIPENSDVYCNAGGGTQTSGGLQSNGLKSDCTNHASFGLGSGSNGTSASSGGGGGFYGGASGSHGPAAGGSGYIGNPLLANKVMYCYNCKESSDESTKTISTTNVSKEPISNYVKIGDGFAKITLLAPPTDVVTYGVTHEVLYTPTREGYAFTGWIVSGTGASLDGTKLIIGAGDVTLTASWTIDSYAIKYELNGGTLGSGSPTSGEYGSTITLVNPQKTGYTFTGWSVSGTGASLSGTKLTMGTGDVTLTAKWKATKLYLYKTGDECTDVTGGIKVLQWIGGSYGSPTATVTKKTNSITCTATRGSSDGNHSFAAIYTEKKISLKDYDKLVVTFNSIVTEAFISVFSQKPTDNSTGRLKSIRITTNTGSLSISGIDEGYIVIGARTNTETTTKTHSVDIATVYLE